MARPYVINVLFSTHVIVKIQMKNFRTFFYNKKSVSTRTFFFSIEFRIVATTLTNKQQ